MRAILAFVLLIACGSAQAIEFVAVCKADGVHAYRHSTDIGGNDMPAEWSSGEKFAGSWRFSFSGGDTIEIDGNESAVLYWNGNILIAIDGGTTDVAAQFWTYAINLDLEEIVGAQVNGFRMLGTGLKTRAVNFKCEFTYK